MTIYNPYHYLAIISITSKPREPVQRRGGEGVGKMAKIVDQGTSSRGRGRFARWLRLLTREPVQGEVGKMAMVVDV